MPDGTQPLPVLDDEDALKALIRDAASRLADMDCIGGAQDFLSDVIEELETEVGETARGRDERWRRIEEGELV